MLLALQNGTEASVREVEALAIFEQAFPAQMLTFAQVMNLLPHVRLCSPAAPSRTHFFAHRLIRGLLTPT